MGKILQLIQAALFRATPSVLVTAASKIGTLTRTVVKPTAVSIFTAIKEWVGNNPSKAMLAANLLISAGIELGQDLLAKAMHDDGVSDPKSLQLFDEIQTKLLANVERSTGDGVSTIDGIDIETVNKVQAYTRANNEILAKGIAHAGSMTALRAIREAMFVETHFYDNYGS